VIVSLRKTIYTTHRYIIRKSVDTLNGYHKWKINRKQREIEKKKRGKGKILLSDFGGGNS